MVVEQELTRSNPLSELRFQYPLRRYQQEIIELVNIKLERGERELHIVAPPGAGKTIIGLQIISQLNCKLDCPSLVLCPNTTIQSQWGQKVELFLPPEVRPFGVEGIIGTHEDRPLKPITLLTYQVLSTPGKEQEYLEKLARQSWVDELSKGMSLTAGEAELRILELMQNNPAAHQKEMSRHISRLRRKLTEVMDLKDVLHDNALELLQAFRRQKFRLVLFDECHHLTDYWAAVMTHLVKRLDDPVIVGLTGTPPEGKSASQETRYLSLVGEIDYQVPTPALVKEGGLAPFQDLVYFTEPTEKELEFLERQHEQFHELLEQLTASGAGEAGAPLDRDLPMVAESAPPAYENAEANKPSGSKEATSPEKAATGPVMVENHEQPVPPLSAWVLSRVDRLGKDGWAEFAESKPDLALAIARYLWKQRLPMPARLEATEAIRQSPFIDDWMLLLEDYALQYLKTSPREDDHKVYAQIKDAVRKLGYGLTEQGLRRQASPVDRVLAYSNNKPQAVAQVLDLEYRSLGDGLRAVIVTDFERMSATTVRTLKGVLDTDSGGAVAALRELLAAPISQLVNPCLVTGSLLLVDRRICSQFVEAARSYIREEGFKFELVVDEPEGEPYSEVTAGSSDWETRLYVGMATNIFERGITKCLIGTRGIFGEGWDSQSLNTLIDLTTTTSPVSVKQLRGRSIRLNTNDPLGARKVANNWDVVCIAPELEKGLNDYHRFVRKHDGYFGICDDGQIECGVGHVHAAFSDLTPADVFASSEEFNKEMMERALVRDKIYDLWKVGEPYGNRSLGCVEVSALRKLALTPPHIRRDMKYKAHAQQMRSALAGIWWEYGGLGAVSSAVLAYFLSSWGVTAFAAVLPIIIAFVLARNKYGCLYSRMKKEICQPNTQESSLLDIGLAVLSALQQIRMLPQHITRDHVSVGMRADGSFRVFLDEVEPEQSQYFARCFKEVMAPITNQPFLIPKYEYSLPRAQNGDASENAFFKSYLSGKAEPRIASYHAVPKLLARSEKGREAFQSAWNKYVSPGFIVSTDVKPELLQKYFGMGPSLAQRLLWE